MGFFLAKNTFGIPREANLKMRKTKIQNVNELNSMLESKKELELEALCFSKLNYTADVFVKELIALIALKDGWNRKERNVREYCPEC